MLIILAGICALGLLAVRVLRNGTEFVRKARLVDCTNCVTVTHFQTEKGRDFLLAFASTTNPPTTYSAHVHLADELSKQTADFKMSGDYGLPLDTSGFLHPLSSYDMTITFPSNAQPSVVITLQWVQFGRDWDGHRI